MNKKAMYNISYGLYVLATRQGDKDNACIVNTPIQVTTAPNRIALAVIKANLTHDMIMETGVFTLSVISKDAPFELFQHFGFQSGRDTDKFNGWRMAERSDNGCLHLTSCVNAWISGKVISSQDLGTHTLFLADVTDCEVLSDAESMTYAYYQSDVKRQQKQPEKKGGWRCRVCGYIYEGDELPPDFECPICHHGVDDFERI